MRKKSVRTTKLGTMGLAVLGFGGVASWALGLGAPASTPPEMSPAELISLRFLEVEFAQPMMTDDAAPAASMLLASSGESKPVQLAMLNPRPAASTIESATVEAAKPAPKVATIPLPVARPAQAPSARAVQVAHAAPKPAAARSSNVLNNAQIASIRKRLQLTPDQEEMWPAVEAALRNISYKKGVTGSPQAGSQMAYVDPDSDEVQQLKSVAFPLIMRMNDDQKREVKMLAHVMGLTSVASRL
jgi:hypothetical protein